MSVPIVKQQMLIRLPVEQVFEAFSNPEITTKFWFTHSDGPLEAGKTITWEWRMFGCSTQVQVLEMKVNRLIRMKWGDQGSQSIVEWSFDKRDDGSTLLTVINSEFQGERDAMIREAIDSMGGFSLVLANAKAYLEHQLDLRLIHDHAPDAHVAP